MTNKTDSGGGRLEEELQSFKDAYDAELDAHMNTKKHCSEIQTEVERLREEIKENLDCQTRMFENESEWQDSRWHWTNIAAGLREWVIVSEVWRVNDDDMQGLRYNLKEYLR